MRILPAITVVCLFVLGLTAVPLVVADEVRYAQATIPAPLPTPVVHVDPHAQAVSLARAGDLSAALVMLRELYEQNPQDLTVLGDYIVVLSWNEQFAKAIELYEKNSTATFPPNVRSEVAHAYRKMGGYPKSIAIYRSHLEADPHDREAGVGLIKALIDSNALAQAAEEVDLQLHEHPRSKRWHSLKALIEARRNRWPEFFNELKTAKLLSGEDPRDERAAEEELREGLQLARRGLEQLISRERFAEAATMIDALLEEFPEDPNMKFEKARITWKREGAIKAAAYLTRQQKKLDQSEIEHFMNNMAATEPADQSLLDHQSFTPAAFGTAEAALFVQEWHRRHLTRPDFARNEDALLQYFTGYPLHLAFDVAALVEDLDSDERALELYDRILARDPKYFNAIERIVRIDIRRKQYDHAGKIIEEGLRANRNAYQLLMLKGELLENSHEYLKAVEIYDEVLRLYPQNHGAFNVKMRALMDLGAHSLALEQMENNPYWDPVLRQRARGDMAMMFIRWDEPQRAQQALEDKERKKAEDYRMSDPQMPLDPAAVRVEEGRARWDRIMSLSQNEKYDDVIREYEQAVKEGETIPSWVTVAAADAYIYKRQSVKAMEMYRSVAQSPEANYKSNIALYYTYIDLGRFHQAAAFLDALDEREPIQVKDRGILSDNPRKEEIAYNKVWLLMYQDRLKKAQKVGEQYTQAAPANAQLGSAMAHLALWRGWPRLALERFRILQTKDPTVISASIGYARSLYDNMHKSEARVFIHKLNQKYPANRHVARAQRLIEIDDKGTFILGGYYTREFPGEDEFALTARVEKPVNDYNTLFAELFRRETTQLEGNDLTHRFLIGDIYRPNMTWQWTAGLTGDFITGDKLGAIAGVELTPDDYWTYAFNFDSRSVDVPLRSRTDGIDVEDYNASVEYRLSESFNTKATADFKNFEDGNDNWNYSWTTDSAVVTYADWKWRISTEFDYSTYSRQDVNYYSPQAVYDFYLIPNVEHTWFRHYEKALLDRFFVGVGQQWEHSFGAANVGFLRYELEHRYSDTLSLLLGTVYALHSYDGQDVNSWNTYTSMRKRF